MESKLNHAKLALCIKNNNSENAMKIYEEKLKPLMLSANAFDEIKHLLYSINIFIYTYFCLNHSKNLDHLCQKNFLLIDECTSKEELVSKGKELIEAYITACNDNNITSENEIIKHAIVYIHSNLHNKITLQNVASNVHVSKNYLCRIFKENTGLKFCEYITLCRINLSKDLLCTTSLPLDLISCKCGFGSQSHFCSTFKRYVGTSPSVHRKKVTK